MPFKRRQFLKTATALGGILPFTVGQGFSLINPPPDGSPPDGSPPDGSPPGNPLDAVLAQPVLRRDLFPDPVIIDRLELLRYGDNFLCRVTSTDGAEGLSVSNNYQMVYLYPIFTGRLQEFFIGRDARDWEQLLEEVYVHKSNYKLQNLALWVPLATIEFAVLDMLGKIAKQPIGKLIGKIRQPKIAVYQANNFRGKSAEQSIDLIRKQVEEMQAKALKFKVGGRMSKNADDPPGRSEKLIPLVRQAFGDDMVIYADSNGSYDATEAIRIGKLMEEYAYDFYEEPVPFDWYEETKQVTQALNVPVAGGEQEPSMHTFRWLTKEDALERGAARHFLLRRHGSLDAGGADGGGAGQNLHAPYFGVGPGLPVHDALCVGVVQRGSVP